MKTHEFVVRFDPAPATRPRITAHLGKHLTRVRRIELLQYMVVGATGANTWMIKLKSDFHVESTNSWNQSGYPIAVPSGGPATNRFVVYDRPRLITQTPRSTLDSLIIELTEYDGSPVTFAGEATFWFLIKYDDEITDLSVIQAEAGIKEPVHGANNWRTIGDPQYAKDLYNSMTTHVFSDLL